MALSVLDEHFAKAPGGPRSTTKQRWTRRQKGLPNYRLFRYADDFVILVSGTRSQTEALLPEVAAVLSTVGLRLSEEKTLITHIDEGLDFLGWRIQRHQKRGTDRHYVYNYPAKKALRSIKAKCKTLCRMNVSLPLAVLLHRLNSVLRGWTAYFRPGVSARAFQYLRMIVWRQVFGWLRRKHPNSGWKKLRRRYCDGAWWPRDGEVVLFNPGSVVTTRYRPQGIDDPFALAIGSLRRRLLDGACGEPDAGPTRTSGSGGRHGETDREQSRHRASCRPHHDVYLMDDAGQRLAARRLPEGLSGIRGLHELIAAHADEPDQVMIGIETDRGLWVSALATSGYQV